MKEKFEINFILPFDLASNPSFSGATLMTEIDLIKLWREKEIKHRKDKIEKIKNGFNKK